MGGTQLFDLQKVLYWKKKSAEFPSKISNAQSFLHL